MSKEKQIEGYLTTKLKPKNKIECVAWLLLNVFGCKFCKVCRDKPCNIKDGETCTNNIANYIREAVKEEAGYRKQEWISVDERLPEEDTRVLVYLNIPKTDANTYTFFDTDRILIGKWIRWNKFVSHWMPLPEAPKMKGGAE